MTQPGRSTSLAKKGSQFFKFWKKPRESAESASLVLPTEIWLDILSYFPDHALEPLSRICKQLRWIVLPLFFRSQQMFPFLETFTFRKLAMSIGEYEERSLQRISFVCSDQISPALRELLILYYAPGYNRRHRATHTPVEAVTQPLFLALPKFSNLTKLVLQFPPCNNTLFSALNTLHLDHFELEVLPTALGDIPIPAQKEFLFNCSGSPIQIPPANGLSLRFLFPESLERVVAGPTGTDTLTRALVSHPSGFPTLQTLDLSLRFVASSHFTSALAACPKLSSLRLRSPAIEGCYHGPAIFAPAFARGRILRTVRLWPTRSVSAVSAPWLLHPVLQQLGGEALTSLELGITLVPESLLEAIRDAFPALTTLSINAHLDSFRPGTVERRVVAPPTALHARVALPIGMQLQTLRLGTQLAGAPDDNAGTELMTLFESAREVVRAFPGGYDPTSWRRWAVDQPWYCVEWTRVVTLTADGGGEFGTALDGTLRVEYGEHYFQGFERGARMAVQTAKRLS
ncbi:Ubiquitin family protein [Mycena venus]|uniref:Ubiquitin family protein n=1 Tax=Mycena venus TaxID=2733690 RepID=A0A8H7CM55_9AGAR|nr:Ubiquitin family protein [Mycena venus]